MKKATEKLITLEEAMGLAFFGGLDLGFLIAQVPDRIAHEVAKNPKGFSRIWKKEVKNVFRGLRKGIPRKEGKKNERARSSL
jgi:hypothetical protein